jgi:pyruvate dehydrogenase E1 component alpha subunit
MLSEIVDGQVVGDVAEAIARALERARAGEGPTLLECKTYRYSGHSRADLATYRPEGELDGWLARDPITLHRRRLIDDGVIDEAGADRISAEVEVRIETCIDQTMASAPADVAAMFQHVYASASGAVS